MKKHAFPKNQIVFSASLILVLNILLLLSLIFSVGSGSQQTHHNGMRVRVRITSLQEERSWPPARFLCLRSHSLECRCDLMLLMSKFTWPGEAGVLRMSWVSGGWPGRPQVTRQTWVSDGELNKPCLEMLGSTLLGRLIYSSHRLMPPSLNILS